MPERTLPERLTWCEVSLDALTSNIAEFRRLVGPDVLLSVVVKANAYGHGLELTARAFVRAGADVLCVNDVWEGARLRTAGLDVPVIVLGRVRPEQAEEVAAYDLETVVYDEALARAMHEAGRRRGRPIPLHLKIETGTNRQGLRPLDAVALANTCKNLDGIWFKGMSTHFADIEDTTNHAFAQSQLDAFLSAKTMLEQAGFGIPVCNVANSAATILWPQTHLDMVRLGIAAYGMWPSNETFATAAQTRRHGITLKPALAWKTRIAQIRELSPGEFVGYGRLFRATHSTQLAVLPIGYYDGYDRGLSNSAYVLIRGVRAPIRGRVCMNMAMADVTDVPDAQTDDIVTLLGRDGDEVITAEQFAGWAGTINYEAVTRIAENITRKPLEGIPDD